MSGPGIIRPPYDLVQTDLSGGSDDTVLINGAPLADVRHLTVAREPDGTVLCTVTFTARLQPLPSDPAHTPAPPPPPEPRRTTTLAPVEPEPEPEPVEPEPEVVRCADCGTPVDPEHPDTAMTWIRWRAWLCPDDNDRRTQGA